MTLIDFTCARSLAILFIGKINIIKGGEKPSNVMYVYPIIIIVVVVIRSAFVRARTAVYRSIILLIRTQAPSKCQSDRYCAHTLCKEHDDEKMILFFFRERIQR